MNHFLDELREKAGNLPLLPGVYIMLDEREQVIYVGKAKKLKNRVSSYFHGKHLPKVEAMVDKVHDFRVIIANSELEALVLENSLIKQHKPHYNILLKDDKGYPFIRIDPKAHYPRMTVAARNAGDGADYYGPFGTRGTTFEIISVITRSLLLPDCSRVFPRDIGKERPCLNYQMKTCAGWCLPDKSGEEYRNSIRQATLILQGKSGELLDDLREKMMLASDELRFEYAAELRDRIRAIEQLSNRQRVISAVFADTDAVGFYRGARTCFSVLHFRNGDLVSKDTEYLEEPMEEDGEAICELVRQYYSGQKGSWPRTILLPCDPEDADGLEEYISENAGRRVHLVIPQRGEKHKLLETAQLNAREESLRSTTEEQRRAKALECLQRLLQMEQYPTRIEAYDISNLGASGIVSAMTVHVNGKPRKRDYRKFRMKEMVGPNDYASMEQTLQRRIRRYLDGDPGFAPLPELMLIDGGAEHAATVQKVLQEQGISLPVFGMVKDDRHRTRALVRPDGMEIGIQSNPSVFALVGNIQEETHRCAISYQRSLRRESLHSSLDDIPGVGPKRREQLLHSFKTVSAIRTATEQELTQAVPANTARAVYTYYHPPKEEKS